MTYYRRRTLDAWEEAAALAAGALVGAGVAYLARIWLRRSPTDRRERERGDRREGAERRDPAPTPRTEGGAGRPR